MILYSNDQIEAARKGIEADLQTYLGYFVYVGILPDTEYDITFFARNLGDCHLDKFNELCSHHLARVANINYDEEINQ